jgi:hypothetical protein
MVVVDVAAQTVASSTAPWSPQVRPVRRSTWSGSGVSQPSTGAGSSDHSPAGQDVEP